MTPQSKEIIDDKHGVKIMIFYIFVEKMDFSVENLLNAALKWYMYEQSFV